MSMLILPLKFIIHQKKKLPLKIQQNFIQMMQNYCTPKINHRGIHSEKLLSRSSSSIIPTWAAFS